MTAGERVRLDFTEGQYPVRSDDLHRLGDRVLGIVTATDDHRQGQSGELVRSGGRSALSGRTWWWVRLDGWDRDTDVWEYHIKSLCPRKVP
jgi:hypothetical protein